MSTVSTRKRKAPPPYPRSWDPGSEKILPIRSKKNPLQAEQKLATPEDPRFLSPDYDVVFKYYSNIPQKAIDRLKLRPEFEHKTSEQITDEINKSVESYLETLIEKQNEMDIKFQVGTISNAFEKALINQKGVFFETGAFVPGQIIMPFSGVYSNTLMKNITGEEHYVLDALTHKGKTILIHPSPSQQAGAFINTSFNVTQFGDLKYNREHLPVYNTARINCFFVDKIVTFKHKETSKEISYPIALILYTGTPILAINMLTTMVI